MAAQHPKMLLAVRKTACLASVLQTQSQNCLSELFSTAIDRIQEDDCAGKSGA